LTEPDRGISDAFNKGVALARGEFLQFVNADDWLSHDQISMAVGALDRSGADFVFGDLIFYERGEPSFRYVGDANYAATIDRRLPSLNHPTVLVRRSAFERIGLFSLDYRCAMDYDWFLRLHLAGGHGVYDPAISGHMTQEGVSNREFARTLDEVRRISIAHGRSAIAARVEQYLRLLKSKSSFLVRGRSDGLYRFIRRAINRSYLPVS